jgi:tripartite-type tricarboxylate transporter receptor subunit TctC
MGLLSMRFVTAAAIAAVMAAPVMAGEPPVSFKDKTITMIIPSTAGGSTDMAARLFVKFFGLHLPGKPAVVAQNVPGAQGVTALNYMVQQVKPDGLTITMSSSAQVDPINYRLPQAKYDPTKFELIGSIGIGNNVMVIRTEALPRLLDKTKPPVIMGNVSGIPRTGKRMTIWGAEYLGWNTKWVVGYPGVTDLLVAMERGEVDMTSFPGSYLVDRLTDTAKYKMIYQDGIRPNPTPVGRADVDNAPMFDAAMAGKIKDPTIKSAYDYSNAITVFKWIALPPKTPAAIRDAYRETFMRIADDPIFKEQAIVALEGYYTIQSPQETVETINSLAATSDEALEALNTLLRKHGFNTTKGK